MIIFLNMELGYLLWCPGWVREDEHWSCTHTFFPALGPDSHMPICCGKKKNRQGLSKQDRLFDLRGCQFLALRLTADAWNKQAHKGASIGVPAEGQLQLWQQMPKNELTQSQGLMRQPRAFIQMHRKRSAM